MSHVLVIPIGRPTFDLELGSVQVAAAMSLLDSLGVQSAGVPAIVTDIDGLDDVLAAVVDPPELVVVLQATFADASLVGRIADRIDAPMVVWSFPEARTGERLRLNSLCGANLAAYLLRRRGALVRFVHVDPTDPSAVERSSREALATANEPIGVVDRRQPRTPSLRSARSPFVSARSPGVGSASWVNRRRDSNRVKATATRCSDSPGSRSIGSRWTTCSRQPMRSTMQLERQRRSGSSRPWMSPTTCARRAWTAASGCMEASPGSLAVTGGRQWPPGAGRSA